MVNFKTKKLQDVCYILFDELKNFSGQELNLLYENLPTGRKQKVDEKFSKTDKDLAILEYFMAKQLLNLKKQDFCYNKNGKPYVRGKDCFSISNCNNIAVVASCKNQIGVDIQKVMPYNEDMAKFVCNKKELYNLNRCKNKNKAFTKLFCKKECFLKCFGLNLSYDFKLFNYKDVKFKFLSYKNYIIAFCVKI